MFVQDLLFPDKSCRLLTIQLTAITAICREKLLAWQKTDNEKAILSLGENPLGQERTNACTYFLGQLIWSCSKYKRLVYLPAQRQSQPCHAFIPYSPSSAAKHKTLTHTHTQTHWCESHCSPAFNICRPLKVKILPRTAESLYPSSTKPRFFFFVPTASLSWGNLVGGQKHS